jgi:hypothetical protein
MFISITSVPSFPGLRRFPEGRRFKQWTGNDSKALMKVKFCYITIIIAHLFTSLKVFLPAIVGHVPTKVIQCVTSFLDFCYLARRSSHNEDDLIAMAKALESFHEHRTVFVDVGIAADEISLPCQHALDHYITGITLFASPNGLCTSITESKHIRAVKEPWRCSSRNNALGQMLKTNEHLDKLSATCMTFKMHGLLEDDIIADTLRRNGQFDDESSNSNDEGCDIDDEEDAGRFDGRKASSHVKMASKHGAQILLRPH